MVIGSMGYVSYNLLIFWFVYWGFSIYIPLDGENLGPLRILGMSWGVKTTCLEALFGVSLGGFGVSIGGVRSLRDCRISRWKHLLRCSMGLLYLHLRATFRGQAFPNSSGLQVFAQALATSSAEHYSSLCGAVAGSTISTNRYHG